MEQESRSDIVVAPGPLSDAAERVHPTTNLARGLRQIARHPALWTFVAFIVFWRVYLSVAPQIDRVELDASGRLEVLGHGFGVAKGQSRLDFGGLRNQVPLDIIEWRDQRVVANLGSPTNGSVTLTRDLWSVELPDTALVRVPLQDLPSQPYGYTVPVQAAAPWPLFRRDHRNSGRSDFPARYPGTIPWSFQTGNAVASTPVIDESDIAYFGSGDGSFYAVDSDGHQLWRYATGGRVGGAGALLRANSGGDAAAVVFPSGDGRVYRISTDSEVPCSESAFEASMLRRVASDGAFESNIAVGDDGTIYAGNNEFSYYALTAAGTPKWTYKTGDSARSTAAIGADGTVFWGGVDGVVRAVNTDGSTKWSKGTQGIVDSSAAIGSDGTIYIGSFDSHLYALDPATGSRRWSFKTDDHIVATVALAESHNITTAIYLASTDGRLYALDPRGNLLWKYDTGEPIRSSPAVGLGPKSETPGIVYFGGANGKLYAINAATGRRRWSFDTTPSDPELHDRNDVSSSVALSANGVYLGTESGALWFVPYDYCLHADDARCSTAPGEDLTADQFGLTYVSPGGTSYASDPPLISPASMITMHLVTRERGRNVNTSLCHTPYLCSVDNIHVETEPAFPYRLQVSGDGHYLHIIPTQVLQPDTDYDIRVEADYYTGGFQIGNLTLGGTAAGTVIQKLTLRTDKSTGAFPLKVGKDVVSALELTRIGAPMPATLTSLHQAGLDASAWILSLIHDQPPRGALPGRVVVWGIGARRNENGVLVPDPDPRRTLAFSGRYNAGSFIFEAGNFVWNAGAASVPVSRFELRGQLGPDLRVRPGASFLAEASASSVPGFGSQLVLGGLLNNAYDNLLLGGTYVTRPYDPIGTANKRPPGLRVSMVERARPLLGMPGKIVADLSELSGVRYSVDNHRIGIVLIDKVKDEVVPLNYADDLYVVADPDHNARQVILSVPPDTELSHDVEIVVLLDAFPVHRADLGWTLAVVK